LNFLWSRPLFAEWRLFSCGPPDLSMVPPICGFVLASPRMPFSLVWRPRMSCSLTPQTFRFYLSFSPAHSIFFPPFFFSVAGQPTPPGLGSGVIRPYHPPLFCMKIFFAHVNHPKRHTKIAFRTWIHEFFGSLFHASCLPHLPKANHQEFQTDSFTLNGPVCVCFFETRAPAYS